MFDPFYAALFNDPFVSNSADYQPETGENIAGIRVIVSAPDVTTPVMGFDAVSATMIIEVRATDIAAPKRDDVFVIDGIAYVIKAAPKANSTRGVWRCEAVAQ
ncbi:head-tail joining protein [Thalassospira marina]|uniref:Uncharacterized protein n=1 Tax=Thalassospira marina TaxID=2048283 RepID=A0A2N3KV40_9PROT|nr:hypothetical protein [Thalassospira marina]PKR54407.1 hypothetical protein COO20_09770 [Thalassospira marina]